MKWAYESQTMGNVVDTRLEIAKQIVESLFKFRCLDLRWKKIECYETFDEIIRYEGWHDFPATEDEGIII